MSDYEVGYTNEIFSITSTNTVSNYKTKILRNWINIKDKYNPNYKPSLLEKIIAGLKLDYKKIEHPETGEYFYYKMVGNIVIKIGYFDDDGDFISYNPFLS